MGSSRITASHSEFDSSLSGGGPERRSGADSKTLARPSLDVNKTALDRRDARGLGSPSKLEEADIMAPPSAALAG
jgi:hypothetical protein